jgi:hypothetical protein
MLRRPRTIESITIQAQVHDDAVISIIASRNSHRVIELLVQLVVNRPSISKHPCTVPVYALNRSGRSKPELGIQTNASRSRVCVANTPVSICLLTTPAHEHGANTMVLVFWRYYNDHDSPNVGVVFQNPPLFCLKLVG